MISSPSMIFLAALSARTLNPKSMESVAKAKFASDSEIPPTPEATNFIDASSLPISDKAATIASDVPATSDFKMTFNIFLSDCNIKFNSFDLIQTLRFQQEI